MNQNLGTNTKMPYFLTSCAGQRMLHGDGEIATANASKNHGLGMTLFQLTASTFLEVHEAHPEGSKLCNFMFGETKSCSRKCLIVQKKMDLPLLC